jgi:hypothetical protein
MDDDFNTAQALGYFYDLQTHLNTLLNLSKGHPTEEIAPLLKKPSVNWGAEPTFGCLPAGTFLP